MLSANRHSYQQSTLTGCFEARRGVLPCRAYKRNHKVSYPKNAMLKSQLQIAFFGYETFFYCTFS